jgi:AraC family transcriptional regulator, transcriptional activator of pobA
MNNDKKLLREFKEALQKSAKDYVLNLDEKFMIKFDFEVQRFEDVLKYTNGSIPPNRWSYHRLALLKKGSGDLITGIYKFRAEKNTLIATPSRVITSSKNWDPGSGGYIVLFKMDFFLKNKFPHTFIEGKKIFNPSVKPYFHASSQQADEVTEIFETIIKEKNDKNHYSDEMIATKIIELTLIFERLFEGDQHFEMNMPSIDIIKHFIDLLEVHVLREHSVKFYADHLALHPNYFNSLIKKYTGVTAKETIQNRLLLETKFLLHSTNLSIKEISNKLGFNDPNYFTSFFTRFEKISPGNYRASFL